MAKKNFKKVADDNPVLAFLGNTAPNDVRLVRDVDHMHDARDVHTIDDVHSDEKVLVKYTNINLRIPQISKNFLADESWKSRMNITQYINELIKADMGAKREGQGESHV